MGPARRAFLLAYCRIDELSPEEEPVLEAFAEAAETYLTQAGISKPAEEDSARRAMYELCLAALVLDFWDRRGAVDGGRGNSSVADNVTFRRNLNQLKLTEPLQSADGNVSNLDTSPGEGGEG